MVELKHLQRALAWSVAGLVLTSLLINLIGFASPFWGMATNPGSLDASRDLLKAWQPITPWFSVCFAMAGWHLAMTHRSTVARVVVVVLGLLVPVAHVVPITVPEGLATLLAEAYLSLASLAFVVMAWRAVRRSNESIGAALAVQPARG